MTQSNITKPHKMHLIILLAVAVLCFGMGTLYGRYLQRSEQMAEALLTPLLTEEEETIALPPNPQIEEEPALLVVHIKGAVDKPGVYKLTEGSRLADALDAAGLLETANTDIINLAAELTDGMEVIVPFRQEGEETDWQALAQSKTVATVGGSSGGIGAGPININSAGLAELQTLTGIGPAKAQAIIDYREQHGAFSRIEDIKKVSGIGEATFAGIKDHICI